jgi:hypothetical protein
MALTPATVRGHIERWSERLRDSPRQAEWPRHLYHAAHVTTAVQILRAGRLSCRRPLAAVKNEISQWNFKFHGGISNFTVKNRISPCRARLNAEKSNSSLKNRIPR